MKLKILHERRPLHPQQRDLMPLEFRELRILLPWMASLETTLEAGRRALLALDLAGMTKAHEEQLSLARLLPTLLNHARLANQAAAPAACDSSSATFDGSEQAQEFWRAQKRIFEALRLQAALLTRSQSKLRVIANMLAHPSANYSVPLEDAGRAAVLGT